MSNVEEGGVISMFPVSKWRGGTRRVSFRHPRILSMAELRKTWMRFGESDIYV